MVLSDIAVITMGQSPSGESCNSDGLGTPLLNGPSEFTDRYPIPVQWTTDSKRHCEPGDLLLCVRGSTTGKMNIADRSYSIGRGLASIRHIDGLALQAFLFALIKYHLPELLAGATGSTFPNLSRSDIFSIPVPEMGPGQSLAIAEVLSSLDDKIDLLKRQNKTLEGMAEALFRQWFIEEAQDDWEEVRMGELIEIRNGKDHKHLGEGKIPVYGSGGLMRKADDFLFEGESVLLPRKGTLNNVMLVNEAFWTVDTMFYTEMKRPNLMKFVFHHLKRLDLASMNVGSAVPSMTKTAYNDIAVLMPTEAKLEAFELQAFLIYEKVTSNNIEIQILTAQRDTLLPKLMSGEVRVKLD